MREIKSSIRLTICFTTYIGEHIVSIFKNTGDGGTPG